MYYENFLELCEERGVKPGTVSRATGVSTSTLTAWKQGKYTPKQNKLQKIADYFDVPLERITQESYSLSKSERKLANSVPGLDDMIKDSVGELIAKELVKELKTKNQKFVLLYELFNELNDEGKDLALYYLQFLSEKDLYTKDIELPAKKEA